MNLLDEKEQVALDYLGRAWSVFLELERLHPDELDEFRHTIHEAQRIITSRPVIRATRGREV